MEVLLSRRLAVLVATAVMLAAMLVFGSPTFAQEDHTSCQDFGNGVAALAQSVQPNFGQAVVIPGPANEDIHGFHLAFCEPKS
jgi:hypothetical protein